MKGKFRDALLKRRGKEYGGASTRSSKVSAAELFCLFLQNKAPPRAVLAAKRRVLQHIQQMGSVFLLV